MNKSSPIGELKGIGTKTSELFEKMGVYTVGDILLRFPRNYVQYPKAINFTPEFSQGSLPPGENCAIKAAVTKSPVVKQTRKMPVTVLALGFGETVLEMVWYRMPYVKNQVQPGKQYVFYGKVTTKGTRLVMEQPVIYTPEQYEPMELQFFPVYSLTAGITNNLMIKTIRQALSDQNLFADYLPDEIRLREGLCEYNYAVKQIHFPDGMERLIEARKRLVFDEFFLFIMGMQYQKTKTQKEPNHFTFAEETYVSGLMAKLPYELTGAQKRTINEIISDMKSPYVMQRLIQGDVGSGKTIIAFLAMALAAHSGYQSAIMAPTEVLARQHYESFVSMCQTFSIDCPVILLTGSLTASQKKKTYQKIMDSPNAMIIGTHALIQEKAVYANLALVITDEQHRFGVRQREIFSEKGTTPHILVMSATPIPRTLAIILYGDMDISVIDEVPAKRLPNKNCVVGTAYRPKAYAFIEEQVKLGHQAYVICPLVEETEQMEGENATDYAKMLREYYGGTISVGLLHGKMKNDKKNEIMEAFAKNEIQVLVSTTVVEVGVNVPNATVMMIENADHFGLAQLHQLRGRVGRGDAQSYCIMINTSNTKTAKKRLEILNHSNDGFYIAGEDLKLRGPGDFFGIRQSGDLAFQLADIYQDADVLKRASDAVKEVLERDPELSSEEHRGLRMEMRRFMDEQLKKMNL
jgi:ATP-dependent DNA helicase RecG